MTGNANRSDPGDRGFALIIVLSAALLLAVIAQSFVTEVRTDANLARNLRDNGQARAIADGAVYRAVALLIRDRSQPTIVADGRPVAMPAAGAAVTLFIQDESGRIDLNGAPADLLRGLFLSAGAAPDKIDGLVDAILDWRDRDDLRRLHGAEDGAYRAAGLTYGAKDGAFETVDELRLVIGMTPELFAAVAPALTVYSGKRGVDLRVAPKPVLLALGQNDEQAASAFFDARSRSSGEDPAANRAAFDVSPRLIANSPRSTFEIRASARLPNGALFIREAVVRLAPGSAPPYRILRWQRGTIAADRP